MYQGKRRADGRNRSDLSTSSSDVREISWQVTKKSWGIWMTLEIYEACITNGFSFSRNIRDANDLGRISFAASGTRPPRLKQNK